MSFVAILPLLLCILAIAIAKKSAGFSSSLGIGLALILCLLVEPFQLTFSGTYKALQVSLILTLSTVLVIVLGLYFNALLREQGIIQSIQEWVDKLPFSAEHKVLLLLFGLLPTVESLTGFGVSLFLSIPIFFHLFKTETAARLSMLGMNIMPWGTLSLATIVGAGLAHTSITTLGFHTAYISAWIFPTLALIALYTIGGWNSLRKNLLPALFMGALISICLLLFNALHLVEIAGVLSGITVCLFGILILPHANQQALGLLQAIKVFYPYCLVLLVILLLRLYPHLYDYLGQKLIISSDDVSLKILNSPGIVLLLIALCIYLKKPVSLSHKALWSRAYHVCIGLFAFVLLAQIMAQSGMITVFATGIVQWPDKILLACSPLLGMLSGFITGSNVSGNALMMTIQSHIGTQLKQFDGFVAIQNSSAGHAVFASIPIILLIITIAKDHINNANMEILATHHLLRIGFKVYLILIPVIMGAGFWANVLLS